MKLPGMEITICIYVVKKVLTYHMQKLHKMQLSFHLAIIIFSKFTCSSRIKNPKSFLFQVAHVVVGQHAQRDVRVRQILKEIAPRRVADELGGLETWTKTSFAK